MSLELRLNRRDRGERRCAYCHEGLDEPAPCPLCGAALHAACWDELRGCPSIGCGFDVEASPLLRRRWSLSEAPKSGRAEAPSSLSEAEESWLERSVPVPSEDPHPSWISATPFAPRRASKPVPMAQGVALLLVLFSMALGGGHIAFIKRLSEAEFFVGIGMAGGILFLALVVSVVGRELGGA